MAQYSLQNHEEAEMSEAPVEFSNRVGGEMFQLLTKRLEEFSGETNFDRYSALSARP